MSMRYRFAAVSFTTVPSHARKSTILNMDKTDPDKPCDRLQLERAGDRDAVGDVNMECG